MRFNGWPRGTTDPRHPTGLGTRMSCLPSPATAHRVQFPPGAARTGLAGELPSAASGRKRGPRSFSGPGRADTAA